MSDQGVVVFGIPIPSSSRIFLAIVAVHIAAGLTCVVAGILAMLSPKRAGRHPKSGTVYFWSLVVVFVSMAVLSVIRWPADNHLFALGMLSLVTGIWGRRARRRRLRGWARHHILGMGLSYIFLLTAFYVDNGPHLPLWRELPPITYWIGPSVVGAPLLLWALLHHPLVRQTSGAGISGPAPGGGRGCLDRRRKDG